MKYHDGVMEKNILEDKNKWLEGEVNSLNTKQSELMNKMSNDTVQLQTVHFFLQSSTIGISELISYELR